MGPRNTDLSFDLPRPQFLDFPTQSCTAVLPSAQALHDPYSQFQNTWKQDQLRPTTLTVCLHAPEISSLLILATSVT